MAQASLTQKINVPIAHLFKIVCDGEKYPEFLSSVKSIKVERQGSDRAKVSYVLDLFTEVVYTVDQREDAAKGVMSWTLLESTIFKKNTGSWTLKEISPTVTEATYALEVEFKIFVPGFVLKKLTAATLPDMMRAFSKRAEKTFKAAG